jgi:hypothetical protein
MFRSLTIIRELALNLAKVIFTLKHSAKLRRYYAVVWQHVMEWRVCCMLSRMRHIRILHSIQHTRHSMTCCHTTA